MMGPVHTRRKKNRQAKVVQWAEKQAAVEDKHRSHMDQAQKNALSGEKKTKPPQLSSSVISQVGKNQSGFQKPRTINSKIP